MTRTGAVAVLAIGVMGREEGYLAVAAVAATTAAAATVPSTHHSSPPPSLPPSLRPSLLPQRWRLLRRYTSPSAFSHPYDPQTIRRPFSIEQLRTAVTKALTKGLR